MFPMISRLILGTFAVFSLVLAALAGPALTTRWNDAAMSQDACLDRAEAAILNAGFSRIERAGQSKFGTFGDYTASIRCVTAKDIVFFIVSGPSRADVSRHVDALANNF